MYINSSGKIETIKCWSAALHLDLVKLHRWRRDFCKIIIIGWVGEKSLLGRMQGNEGAASLLDVGAIPAMGHIPEAGFTSEQTRTGWKISFQRFTRTGTCSNSREAQQLEREEQYEACSMLIQEVYPSNLACCAGLGTSPLPTISMSSPGIFLR